VEVTLALDEAVTLARASGRLPDAVADVRGDGRVVQARVRLRELTGLPGAARAAARLVDAVDARLEDRGVSGRTWTVALQLVHPMLRAVLAGFVTDALRGWLAKALDGVVSSSVEVAVVRTEDAGTVVEIDLDALAGLLPVLVPAARGVRVRIEDIGIGERVRARVAVEAG
jgi:hypothetical protein